MQLSSEQISFLQKHWRVEDRIMFHRHVANYVYFARMDGRDVVLRLTEPAHRQIHEIESELHWMRYLNDHKMNVVRPIATLNGEYIIQMSGEKTFFVALFEKVKGMPLRDEEAQSPQIIKNWGQYLGKMHKLTKKYQPTSNIKPRQQWRDESLAMAMRSVEKEDVIPYQRMHELLEWMESLPQSVDCYGLVHTDLHRGNFFVDQGQIMAYDFDDSCYHWFSYDFAAPINSIVKTVYEGNKSVEKEQIFQVFLSGYSLENTLSRIWIERIEAFDMYRAVLAYHWIKTFTREGVFDEKGIEWGKIRAPQLLQVMKAPLKLV